MKPPRATVFAGLCLAALAGCSLLTSLDGLSSGDVAAEGGDGDAGDAGDAVVTDAALEDAATDAPDGGYLFRDEFDRADTASGLGGRDWVEKTPAFRVASGAALRFKPPSGGMNYRDSIASRPPSEAVADVDVSLEFEFLVGGGGYVQVHARVQTSTVGAAQTLDSYLFFRNLNFSDDRTFTLARQRGNATFTTLTDFQTSVPIDTNTRYRIRLVATGTMPVSLVGTVEQRVSDTWTEIGRGTASDTSQSRISTSGVVGISAGNDSTGVFRVDNFEARGL
ncbi:MAG: hypothetical protein KF819_14210 [Labilithrix sp.]|nr:hypothetical protein [Labilithrix sp.]